MIILDWHNSFTLFRIIMYIDYCQYRNSARHDVVYFSNEAQCSRIISNPQAPNYLEKPKSQMPRGLVGLITAKCSRNPREKNKFGILINRLTQVLCQGWWMQVPGTRRTEIGKGRKIKPLKDSRCASVPSQLLVTYGTRSMYKSSPEWNSMPAV